ncbi:unnamed protein product [Closterium sp. NIES-64]|nr:unnamed protein product [Closterium sp. NIES-64]
MLPFAHATHATLRSVLLPPTCCSLPSATHASCECASMEPCPLRPTPSHHHVLPSPPNPSPPLLALSPPRANCCCAPRDLSYNFFKVSLDTWVAPLKLSTSLLSLRLNNNYFFGSVPLFLVSFSKLPNLKLNLDALTGTFPAPISTALKRLLVDRNFMAGTFPANSATYYTAFGNCIGSYTTCNSLYPNSPVSNCNICGMTNALGTACMGNPCVPMTPSPITATNRWDPMPTMRCDPVPIQSTQAAALVAMAPGLWTQPMCTIAGQAAIPGTLPVVFCNPAGMVLDIVLTGVKATGFFPTDSSKLTALTKLDLSVNLFSGRLDTFLAPFLPLKSLLSLRLHQNYFSGSFPANVTALSALTELRLNLNYLTGSMPAALPATLKAIDLSSNYHHGHLLGGAAEHEGISGRVALLNMKASLGVTYTDWALDSPYTIQGLALLPGAWSNIICNVSGKVMSLAAAVSASYGKVLSLLLHVSFTPSSPASALWPISFAALTSHAMPCRPSLYSYVRPPCCRRSNLRSNFLEGRLDVFALNFKALTSLKEAYLDFNWFTGPIPSTLVGIATLSTFSLFALTHSHTCTSSQPTHPLSISGASYNYLYGAMPTPGAALKTIAVDGNWLSGTFPGTGFSSCSATNNCLASIATCTTAGTVQRAAAACAVCDTTGGSGTVCGGGTCAPNTATPLSTGTPNSATAAVLPRFYVGMPLDATQGNILLSLKTTLGITFSDWTAATLAAPKATGTKPKAGGKRRVLQARGGRGSGLLYDWKAVGSCTIVGQTPIAGSWTGVRCSPVGQILALVTDLSPLPFSAPAAAAVCARGAVRNVVSRDLRSQLLSGTVHSDISKLSTLTSLRMTSNLFFNRLDSYIVPITPTATLKEMHINFNWFYGTIPTMLLNMPALSFLMLGYNYLTGTLPKPGAAIKALDTERNFLSGTFPTATLAYCSARANCFLDATACFSIDGVDQRGAGCNVCGSSNGQLPMCGGAVCTPDPSAYVASKVPNSGTAPTLALKCPALGVDACNVLLCVATCRLPCFSHVCVHGMGVHVVHAWACMDARSLMCASGCPHALFLFAAAALINIGAALGVTHTDWSTSSGCNIIGQGRPSRPSPGRASGAAAVVPSSLCEPLCPLEFPFLALAAISFPNYRQLLSLGYNLLYNLPVCAPDMLGYNYLTGTLPKPGAAIKALDTERNFLSGTFPTATLAYCSARANCFLDATACFSIDGVDQRGAGCNVCGSSNGQLPMCGGAVCTPDPSAYVASKVPNSGTAPTLALKCPALGVDACNVLLCVATCRLPCFSHVCVHGMGVHVVHAWACMDARSLMCASGCPHALFLFAAAALINIGAALGVTHTDWSTSSGCNIIGQGRPSRPSPGRASGAAAVVPSSLCEPLCPLEFPFLALAAISFPNYRQLLSLGYNLLYGSLATFASNIMPLTSIVTLNLHANYLYDSVPSTLLNMASLTEMRLFANYLTGSLPAVSTKLKYLVVNNNFLAGAFPSQVFNFCYVRSNCFASPGTCTNTNGVAQHTSGCAICTTTNAAPPLCGGAPCVLNASAPLAAGTVNSLTAALQPFYCGPATIDATTAQALLVLRAALGVTQSNWLVDLPCDIAGNPPMPGSWVGVACDTAGQVGAAQQRAERELPADITKLTALTRINMAGNLLEARVGEWATGLSTLKALKHLRIATRPPSPLTASFASSSPISIPCPSTLLFCHPSCNSALNYNWFSGPLPSYLLTLSTLTTL